MNDQYVLGVIGGSGLYSFPTMTESQAVDITTPFGKPSAPIMTGKINGKKVAFLARHGIGHTLSPSEVNYQANIYALKSIGVPRIVSVSACGSLRDDFVPGNLVVPDGLVDFTRGTRRRTFFGEGLVVHVGSADPFCKDLSAQLVKSITACEGKVHDGGTFITIEGPRFSTRSESNLFRAWGMSIIGMTASPEAFLAREAEMHYAVMAHVTDYDVWHISEAPVTVEMVIRTLNQNTELAQKAIVKLVENLEPEINCGCSTALRDAIITSRPHINSETRQKLDLLVGKYL